jgi:hypothetical protein
MLVGCGSDPVTIPDDMTAPADLTVAAADMAKKTCGPEPIGSFAPVFRPPTVAHQNRCSAIQVQEGVSALSNGGFASFKATDPDCAACLVTSSSEASYGPIVYVEALGIFDGNRDGCLAHWTGDRSAGSCAAKVQAMLDCGVAACGPSCPIKTNADIKTFNVCAGAAFSGVCAGYASAAQCANAALDDAGSPHTECFLGAQGVAAWFTYLATLFCGA